MTLVATLAVLAALVWLAAVVEVASAATLPAGFASTPVLTGLTQPTVVRFASDGRVFVAEKSGLIKVYDSLADNTPTTFADLRTQVDDYWDRGLLGLVLDPGFPATPYVYALYSLDAPIGGTAPVWNDGCPTPPGPTADGCVIGARLVRMTASGDVISGNPQTLIEGWCQQYPSHSVGQLQFGPDGALYATAGDGASFTFADYGQQGNPLNPCGDPPVGAGTAEPPGTSQGGALRSQSVRRPTGTAAVLNGALLRVDPATGAALPSNPLFSRPDANGRRIVAYGMRNPFRFTFRPGTSEAWIGDVGWNDWEEIERVPNPTDATVENFGWPCYEGMGQQAGYASANLGSCSSLYSASPAADTKPYFTYQHGQKAFAADACSTTTGSSISGLAFYTGGAYPGSYNGALFFSDYSRNCVYAMLKGANGLPDPARIQPFVTAGGGPVELETGPGADLFYPGFDSGTIERITYTAANNPPAAAAAATPTGGAAPLTVQFDGSGSTDADGDPLTYAWDLDGDGAYDDSTALKPSFTYTTPGRYTVRLKVTDSHSGQSVSAPLTINAGAPPSAHIDAPLPSLTWKVGDTIAFAGGASDAVDGTVAPAGLTWTLLLHHCSTDLSSCHVHQLQTFSGAGGSFVAPDHDYPSYIELRLTATDSLGLSDTRSVSINPRTVDLSFRTVPAGLRLAVGSGSQPTPFTSTVIIGSTNSVSAPTPQTLGATTYTFTTWSDGGAQTHTILAPAAPATYSASYAVGRSGFSASPAAVTFPNTTLNQASAAAQVNVTDTGVAPLSITSVALGGANPGDFAITSNACAGKTVAAGAGCAVAVVFKPKVKGTRSAALIYTDDAPGSPHSVPLSGPGCNLALWTLCF